MLQKGKHIPPHMSTRCVAHLYINPVIYKSNLVGHIRGKDDRIVITTDGFSYLVFFNWLKILQVLLDGYFESTIVYFFG